MTSDLKPIVRRLAAGAALAGLAALAGCQSAIFNPEAREDNPAPCPNVIVLQDAGRMVSFNGAEAAENVAYTAEITNVSTSCRYYGDAPIEAEVEIDFAFGRGPAAGGSAFDASYFVAVTRTNRSVIAREEYTLPVRFRGDRLTVNLSDTVGKITIPRRDEKTSGTNFEIVVGLSLTREQLLYNRSGRSLRFPELD